MLSAYAAYRIATDPSPKLSAVAPLAAGALVGLTIIAVPLGFTLELAAHSNRPEIDLDGALKGLDAARLLLHADFRQYVRNGRTAQGLLGPAGRRARFVPRAQHDEYLFGRTDARHADRGDGQALLPNKEIRFFAAAALFFALYALGRYTPAFALFYRLPGVDLWRRPADATFLLGATLRDPRGLWLQISIERGSVDAARRLARSAPSPRSSRSALLVAGWKGHLLQALLAARDKRDIRRARRSRLSLRLAMGCCAALSARRGRRADERRSRRSAIGPNESTALPPEQFDALRTDGKHPVIAYLREKLKATAAPDRRDRIELAAIDFHWPNASLVHGFDHDLGYNPIRLRLFEDATGAGDHLALPEQRQFSKLYPCLSLNSVGHARPEIHRDRRPDRTDR